MLVVHNNHTNEEQPSKPLLDFFKSIGLSLADGVKKDPYLSALVLIVLIAAIVAVVTITKGGLYTFLAIAIATVLAIVIISCFGVKRQKARIVHYTSADMGIDRNTINLVNKLDNHDKQTLLATLKEAAEDVADVLKINPEYVRANLFGVDGKNRMKMLAGLTHQMKRGEELTISMPVGYGSTGRCFQSGKPNIAIFRGGWGKDVIEDKELRKAHPELQWIISVPVLSGGEERRTIWVLNVDGIIERREKDDLQAALKKLFVWSQMITLILAKALEKQGA